MRTFLRKIARYVFRLYIFEYGRYTLLEKIFFPYLSPQIGDDTQEEVINMSEGFFLNVSPREYLHAYFYCFGSYEKSTVQFLKKSILQNATVVNIGANIGYMAIVLSRIVGEQGKVIAIEPENKNFSWLQKNVDINHIQNISTIQKAISNRQGLETLYLSTENSGAHSLLIHHQITQSKTQQISTSPFDAVALEYNILNISAMLIDVEGFELEVFQGMNNIIARDRPIFIVELNDTLLQQRNSSALELTHYICSTFGYQQFRIQSSGVIHRASDTINFENGVFIPKEKVAQFSHCFA